MVRLLAVGSTRKAGRQGSEYSERVAADLKAKRLRAGLTQGDLALLLSDMLGRKISYQHISRYEQARHLPRSDVSWAIADICGQPYDGIDPRAIPAARLAALARRVDELRRIAANP